MNIDKANKLNINFLVLRYIHQHDMEITKAYKNKLRHLKWVENSEASILVGKSKDKICKKIATKNGHAGSRNISGVGLEPLVSTLEKIE